jgi:hypothetical protein
MYSTTVKLAILLGFASAVSSSGFGAECTCAEVTKDPKHPSLYLIAACPAFSGPYRGQYIESIVDLNECLGSSEGQIIVISPYSHLQ